MRRRPFGTTDPGVERLFIEGWPGLVEIILVAGGGRIDLKV
jgi:hypothetical protein